MLKFRKNVALILSRKDGRVLLCERVDFRNSWQFPQGGAKRNETEAEALEREVEEEIGLTPGDYTVISSQGPYRYRFRSGFQKEGCDGQEQTYFLAEISPEAEERIRVDRKEFRAFRWVLPVEFEMDWVPPIKRDVYRSVFRDFFQVELT